ncbi:MAG: hypothetical protein EAZ15_05870 [Sphingobacteriales bacterium]|nr:MAG: hypothetical protein EAZ15_05870 [Sphingobacteriales bacterium]
MDDIEIHQEGEYKIVNNKTTQISTLFKNNEMLHQFTCGKMFAVWYQYYTVLFYDLILVRNFDYEINGIKTLENLYHINIGLVFPEDVIWIEDWPWNDFIVIKIEENKD